MVVEAGPSSAPVRFDWILDRKRDLVFYVFSALVGWLYVGVILYAVWTLDDPLHESFAAFELLGLPLALNLHFLVVLSWAILLDAPHVWATLARTLFDPDEWRLRGRELRRSFVWFLIGPAAILMPYGIGVALAASGRPFSPVFLATGAVAFFVVFRLWAYYHVVRQHWGFFSLYKRKAGDYQRHRFDVWFFNLTMYMPLVMFMTSSFYADTPGMADLGLRRPLLVGLSVADVVHPIAWSSFLVALVGYVGVQWQDWRRGRTLNGSKLLYMLPIIPLHLAAFSHPVLVIFVVPLVTVGHNIQYHCIVYSYARNKYFGEETGTEIVGGGKAERYRWARPLFGSLGAYAVAGLAFTLLFYKGPWIEFLTRITGVALDELAFNSFAMMAGVQDPASLGLGEQLFAATLLGFAMQHYYLDAKIWRVSKDRDVQKHLGV